MASIGAVVAEFIHDKKGTFALYIYSMASIKGPTLLLSSSSDHIVFKFWHLIKSVLR